MIKRKEAIRIDREQLLYGALSRWDGGSIPKDEILKDFLNLMTRMKVEGTSWDEISNEVETRFGVKFDAESLEFLFGLYRDAVRKRMKAR